MGSFSLDDLKKLDPKDIGNWPIVAQLLALGTLMILVVIVGGYFLLSPLYDELDAGKAQEESLKQAFIEKKTKAVNLDAYRQQLFEIQQSFGALLKQLPTKAEMETLLTEINQSGVGRGLRFELFKPAPKENMTTEFAELPIELKIVGRYHDLAAFASDISKLSRIVTLDNITLETNSKAVSTKNVSGYESSMMTLNVQAKTYRALDPEESVAVRKAKDKDKKGQK